MLFAVQFNQNNKSLRCMEVCVCCIISWHCAETCWSPAAAMMLPSRYQSSRLTFSNKENHCTFQNYSSKEHKACESACELSSPPVYMCTAYMHACRHKWVHVCTHECVRGHVWLCQLKHLFAHVCAALCLCPCVYVFVFVSRVAVVGANLSALP